MYFKRGLLKQHVSTSSGYIQALCLHKE